MSCHSPEISFSSPDPRTVFMLRHCIPYKHQASPVMLPQGCVCQGMSLWCHWWILSVSVLALSHFTGLSHESLSLIFWTVIFPFILWHWNIQIIIISPNLEVPVFIVLIFIYFSNLSYFWDRFLSSTCWCPTCSVTKDNISIEHLILIPSSSKCWSYTCVPPCPVSYGDGD